MTTTYKKLASVFLTRGASESTTGYYYGNSSSDSMPIDYTPYKLDTDFGFVSPPGGYTYAYASDSADNIYCIPYGNFPSGNDLLRIDRSTGVITVVSDLNINGSVHDLHIDSNQKFVLTGNFETLAGVTRTHIARLNSDGTLDTSFNPPSVNTSIYSSVLQPDGKILIVGNFTTIGGVTRNRIARLNSDGSLDTSFNPNANNAVDSIALDPDGKILIGGSFSTVGGVTRNYIARLNSDGTLDANFKTTFSSPHSAIDNVNSIAVGSDNEIIIGIEGYVNNAVSGSILKLDRFGNIDTSFIGPSMGFYAGNFETTDIHILEDKKILVTGAWATISTDGTQLDNFYAQNAPYNKTLLNLIRLNSDGSIDLNFRSDKQLQAWQTIPRSLVLSNNDIFLGAVDSEAFNSNGLLIYKKVFDNNPYVLAYTTPLGTQTIVKNIFATNHNDFPVFHDIVVVPDEDDQAGISEKHYYVIDSLVDSNDYELIDAGITLSAGDQIYVYSSTDEDISYNIFGVEITT